MLIVGCKTRHKGNQSTRERLVVTARVGEKRVVKQPVSFLTGSLVLAEIRMVSCDWGDTSGGRENDQHCMVMGKPRISLT